ncbi:MAG: LptF/LptG family permease [Vampirovibrionales bacterium]
MTSSTTAHPPRRSLLDRRSSARRTNPLFGLMDQYILKQLGEFFIISVVVFTLLLFFSDALFDFAKDSQRYGISWDILLALIGLQLPEILANILPLSGLLATLLVYNNLNNQMELIALRMSGVSVYRLAFPALLVALFCMSSTYLLYDYVRPMANRFALGLKRISVAEFNLPGMHENFVYKLYDNDQRLQRLVYISKYDNKVLGYSTVIDLSNPKTLQVTQASGGRWEGQNIEFDNASVHTVSSSGKLTNTTRAKRLKFENFIRPDVSFNYYKPREMNFLALSRWIQNLEAKGKTTEKSVFILLWEKLTVPISALPLTLLAVPLAMSPPRQVKNVGFLSAITVFFLYYLLRYVSTEFGKLTLLPPWLVAFMPVIVLSITAIGLYWRKTVRL